MTYHLRAALPGDEHALALVGQATFLETFAGILDGADIVAHCARQHAPARYAEWLACLTTDIWLAELEPGRAPSGYFVLDTPQLPVPDPQPTDVELKRIYVLSRFHGTGLGAALMGRAIETARARAHRRMLLGVYAGNARALAFYARHGFRRVGDRQFQVGGNTYDDVVHARDL
jgi:GNAT superfamily N-acetyltransferase